MKLAQVNPQTWPLHLRRSSLPLTINFLCFAASPGDPAPRSGGTPQWQVASRGRKRNNRATPNPSDQSLVTAGPAKRQRRPTSRTEAAGNPRYSNSAAAVPEQMDTHSCSICLEELDETKSATAPACMHTFCRSCFGQLVANTAVEHVVTRQGVRVSCPLCRKISRHRQELPSMWT